MPKIFAPDGTELPIIGERHVVPVKTYQATWLNDGQHDPKTPADMDAFVASVIRPAMQAAATKDGLELGRLVTMIVPPGTDTQHPQGGVVAEAIGYRAP